MNKQTKKRTAAHYGVPVKILKIWPILKTDHFSGLTEGPHIPISAKDK